MEESRCEGRVGKVGGGDVPKNERIIRMRVVKKKKVGAIKKN